MPTRRQTLSVTISALIAAIAVVAGAPRNGVEAAVIGPAAAASCSAEAGAEAPVMQQAADGGCAEAPVAAPARPGSLTHSKIFHQIHYHLRLPASRPQILEGLHATTELTSEEEAWLVSALPRQTFGSGDQVMRALFPETP